MAYSIVGIDSVVNIGSATMTAPHISVPAGSIIVVYAMEAGIAPQRGNFSDGGFNTYNVIQSVSPNSTSLGTVFYAWNSVALSNVTLTYTKDNAANLSGFTSFYISGARTLTDPLDSSTLNSNTGNSGSPSVVSGLPFSTAECFLGALFVRRSLGGSGTFTQDTNNAWNNIPATRVVATTGTDTCVIEGGIFVNPSKNNLTYAPTISSDLWGVIITSFQLPDPTTILLPQTHM